MSSKIFKAFCIVFVLATLAKAENFSTFKPLKASKSLKILLRKLQAKTGSSEPERKPADYKTLQVPAYKDSFRPLREDYYKEESERLHRERLFHTAEFQRYVFQGELNAKRKKLYEDGSLSVAEKVRKDIEMSEDYKIKIEEENSSINYKQSRRGPQNRRARNAWVKFWQAYRKDMADWKNVLLGQGKQITKEQQFKENKGGESKPPAKPAAKPKAPPKKPAKKTRRLSNNWRVLQAKAGANVETLKKAWAKRVADLDTQVKLNEKFHAEEFKEFQLDLNRLEDMKAIFESKLSIFEKDLMFRAVNGAYGKIRNATKKVINQYNQDRTNAQNVYNKTNAEVEALYRANKNYAGVTSKRRRLSNRW